MTNLRTNSPKTKLQPAKSQQLTRALEDLECAFKEWDAITVTPTADSSQAASSRELQVKTKKLLETLRHQIEELSADPGPGEGPSQN